MQIPSDPEEYASEGLVLFLFGIFTAYWAQTTRRNAWLWFFLAPLTGLVLLYKNSRNRPAKYIWPSAGCRWRIAARSQVMAATKTTEARWRAVVREQEASGMTVREFSQLRGLSALSSARASSCLGR